MKIISIKAVDIPDAWFQCIYSLCENGSKYTVQHGSYVGETRLQFDHVTIEIKSPYSEPYDSMLPQIPGAYNFPNPVANGYVEQYLPYLMTDIITKGEQYTYGSRMKKQIDYWIEILKTTPDTNQAVLQVGQPSDYLLPDPPCLRHIDMKIQNNTLIFYPYFRSWDLWGGFPANLAGIAVLQKYMADLIEVVSGPIIAASKGLHLYGYVEEMARIRAGK